MDDKHEKLQSVENSSESEQESLNENKENCPSIFDKPDYSYQKPPRKHKLSKRTMSIIVSLVLCVCLAGGAFTALHFWGIKDSDSKTESTSETEQQNYIIDYSAYSGSSENTDSLALGGVTAVDINSTPASYTLSPITVKSTKTDSVTMEETEVDTMAWNISAAKGQDIEGVTFSNARCSFPVDAVLKMPYSGIYAEDRNAQIPQGTMTYFEECGFNKAATSATVNFLNGSSYTLTVGDATPTGGERFVCIDSKSSDPAAAGSPKEDNRIYKVSDSDITFLEQKIAYYVERSLIKPVENETSYSETGDEIPDKYFMSGELAYFDSLTISGSSFSSPISFENCDVNVPSYDSIYLMTSPYEQNVDTDKMASLLSPLSDGFDADDCLSVKATENELNDYGLAKPSCVVSYRVKGQNYTIRIGNSQTISDKSGYAVTVGSNPSVFFVENSKVPFAAYNAEDYASARIYSCDITKIKTMTVKTGGKTTEFNLQNVESDESGTDAQLNVSANGKTIDTGKFRELYVDLLSLTAFERVSDGKNSDTPYLQIEFTYHDYKRLDILKFSEYTDRRYFMSLNGSGNSLVLSTSVDTFINNMNSLLG